jgi:hypothetical protein
VVLKLELFCDAARSIGLIIYNEEGHCKLMERAAIQPGVTCANPAHGRDRENSPNTTHGSGWIVQVQPTTEAARSLRFWLSLSPRAARGERGQTGNLWCALCRLELNDPPTAVGGIQGILAQSLQWVDRSGAAYKTAARPLGFGYLSPRAARGERAKRESRGCPYVGWT